MYACVELRLAYKLQFSVKHYVPAINALADIAVRSFRPVQLYRFMYDMDVNTYHIFILQF